MLVSRHLLIVRVIIANVDGRVLPLAVFDQVDHDVLVDLHLRYQLVRFQPLEHEVVDLLVSHVYDVELSGDVPQDQERVCFLVQQSESA